MIEAIKEAIWLKSISHEIGLYSGIITIYCDNQSAIHLAKNHVYIEISKHIDIRLHFVRDIISVGEIKLEKVSTEDNPSNQHTDQSTTSNQVQTLPKID